MAVASGRFGNATDGIRNPVFTLHGDLLGDRENQNLHEEVLRLIQGKPRAVILDLKNVRFMVSAALGLMIGEYLQANENGVKLMLTNLQDRVRELLYITRLDAYLINYGTVSTIPPSSRVPRGGAPRL
jgi:anti-anti-sigma factor